MISVSAAARVLRLDEPVDDALFLQELIDSASQRVLDWLDRPVLLGDTLPPDAPPRSILINSAIIRAVQILVALDYDEREGQPDETDLGLPKQVHSLLAHYRWFGEAV